MTCPQEVERQYKEGTVKYAIVQVLKAVQPEGLSAAGEAVQGGQYNGGSAVPTCGEQGCCWPGGVWAARLFMSSMPAAAGHAALPSHERAAWLPTLNRALPYPEPYPEPCPVPCRHLCQGQGAADPGV